MPPYNKEDFVTVYAYKIIDMSRVKNTDDHLKACEEASLNYVEGYRNLKKTCGGKLHRHKNGNGYYNRYGNWEYQAVNTGYSSITRAPMPAA